MTKTPTIIILLILISSSFCAYNWTETEHTIQEAINNGVFSGCVLGVSTNNATLLKKAFGTVGPRRGFYSAPVTADMHFDLGYLTEPIGLNPLIMDMYENSLILTTNRISFLYGDFDNNGKRYITVQNIL